MDHEELEALEAAFINGYRDAPDKRAFLDLAGVPLTIETPGEPTLRLLEIRLETRYRVGSAAPGFATRELSYQPLPGALVTQKTALGFVYVSLDATRELSFADVLHARAHGHHEDHTHPAQ